MERFEGWLLIGQGLLINIQTSASTLKALENIQ